MRALRFAFLATASLMVPAFATTAPVTHQPAPQHHAAKHRAVAVRRTAAAGYAGLVVPMDEARVITFKQPIETVFVGNAQIADVTMIDSRHAYVIGKTFGATNVIGLDSDHTLVVNQPITIANRTAGEVTVTRGADSYNYSCTQFHCETNPRPGDPAQYFKNTEDATAQHQDGAVKAAGLTSGSGNNTPQ